LKPKSGIRAEMNRSFKKRREAAMQDAGRWTHHSAFSAQALAPLRELNRGFLALVAVHSENPGELKMTTETAQAIARLSERARTEAADCPYALFDLCFHDDARWRERLVHSWHIADEGVVANDIMSFTRLALFYAWHVASMPNASALLWLGMAESTATAFRAASLDRLPALAASEAVNLSARWSASTFYWRALTAAAARGDIERLRRAQLFGLQLGAARLLP
jgi:hypothetical protein